MYLLLNKKKINVLNATKFKTRFFGLMGKKNINYGILFKNCNSIHTFFMKEPIDILVLKNNIVLDKKTLHPWKIFIYKDKKTSILELPNNTSKNININDHLIFKWFFIL